MTRPGWAHLLIRLLVVDHPGDVEDGLILDFDQGELVVPIEDRRQVLLLEMLLEVLPVPCLNWEEEQ